MDSQHLLVPIKVQALVIDDIVIRKSGVLQTGPNKYAANSGRWSPQLYDYQPLLTLLRAPGPRPFYGAKRDFQGHPTDQLVLDPSTNKEALPQDKDRGIYLHWVLPAGLRHAYTPGLMDFPALPDHWLIVRFARRDSTLTTRAWFIDGGIVNQSSPTNLVFPGADKFVTKNVGKVVSLEEFATANFSGERTTITAIGNDSTGSPTFTAFIAENRNIFSWHDKLEDLRTPAIDTRTTLTYSVLGWYRDPQNEPLSSPAAKIIERRDATNKLLGWLIDPPGWSIDATSAAPVVLLKRRSVFHGMVAHINYWSEETHKGTMLGYPGSPLVGGTLGKSKPSFKVGVGNNAEDALVSLVSSEYSGEQQPSSLEKEQPNLWKALEAVIYREAETLVKSWSVASRDMTVHQNWFATHEAGKTWYIRPKTDKEAVFPADANKTAAETAIQPTPEQLAKLKELNQAQAEADTASRDLAALQQELYARWWKLVNKSKQFRVPFKTEQQECETLVKDVTALRNKLSGLVNRLGPLPDELKSKLPKDELELKYDAAPRFWLPGDPVIVVKNCGSRRKHQFPRQLPCRLPEQIVSTAKVAVQNGPPNTFSSATGVADIATAAQRHLPACPPILNTLLNEASIAEQAIRNLAEKTLPDKKAFDDEQGWSRWTEQLVHDLTWDGDMNSIPHDRITFEPEALNIRPHRLVDLWVKQPWSPLFLDWQITWFPTTQSSTAEQPFGPVWNFAEADFVPSDRRSIPQQGYTVRGRSLLSPIEDRIFKEPVETLRKLLQSRSNDAQQKDTTFPPAVIEVLKRYEVVWSETLRQLPLGGLMGQALTGFHQALLRRDITLPRITPDPARPWFRSGNLENDVRTQLDVPNDTGVTGERLSPPTLPSQTTAVVPFSLIRAGALRIDELWLVDDFGQFADLLGLTAAGSISTGQVFHPRMRWHDDPKVFAMPPRVLQPVRLNFRFTAATESSNSELALSSICGWIFYNPLDQALVLCDRKGELMGHLAIVKDQRGLRINWEAGAGGVAITSVNNPTLKAFAESLVETTPSPRPRLLELLNLIDNALERIRPAATSRDTILVGRPLALVSASVGLELFGKAWSDPQVAPVERPGSGDPKLDALRVRVDLGYARSVEDGLIGYFKEGAYNRIVAPILSDKELSNKVKASDYVADPKVEGLRVGFGAPERLTLLMDPWGSVQAACGLVPAKTITLAHAELNKTVARMEASFRVGPVLVPADKLALPTPTGNKGIWNFSGPLTNEKAAAVVAVDPRYFADQPVIAAEGRLLLLNEE
jgi:hypothetical protein